MRIFLDTCTLQFIYDYGAYVFEHDRSVINDNVRSQPNGVRNLEALHDILQVNQAGASSFSFVLTASSLDEVSRRGENGYLQFAYDVVDTWKITMDELDEDAFSGDGEKWAKELQENQFEYLSAQDRQLIQDALFLECDVFLTVEEKLPKQADHLNRVLALEVMRPFEFWEEKLASHFEHYPWGE